MEKDLNPQQQNFEEIKIIDGKKYKKVDTGYTVRQYFSHETPEKGPGPGWDTLNSVGGQDNLIKRYNIKTSKVWIEPSDLPDEPYYVWQEVEE